MTTKEYRVLRRISHSRRTDKRLNGNSLFEPGSIIELNEDEAKPLLQIGAINSLTQEKAYVPPTPPTSIKEAENQAEKDLSLLTKEVSLTELPNDDEELEEGEFPKVNINTAPKAEILSLRHVGIAIYDKWEAYRLKKSFTSLEEVKQVSGMRDAQWNEIKDSLTV